MGLLDHCIKPDWPAPATVKGLVTTRLGGASLAPYSSFNLGQHVGDETAVVGQHRQKLQKACGLSQQPCWLDQTHSNRIIQASASSILQQADGAYTREQQLACVVMTADCLPLLLCNQSGTQVAAVHGGWRGLLSDIIENAVATFNDDSVLAWLGPAIGATAFEVGDEVRQQFVVKDAEFASAFIENKDNGQHWFADIYLLATICLKRLGVEQIYGGDFCTLSDESRFYSYRRDGVTGRMASLIWIK